MKFHKFMIFKLNLKIFIYLLITLKFVVNESEEVYSDCDECKVNGKFKCVKCDENDENCKNCYNCRPRSYNNDKCYDCSEKFTKPYYSFYSIKNDECISKEITQCTNNITIENNECVDKCDPDYYSFGDYCYFDCLNYEMDNDEFTKTCKCKEPKPYMIKEKIQNKNYFRCIDKCPSKYYDIETKECVEGCTEPKNKIKMNNACTDECGIDEVLFIKKLDNDEEIYYCLDKCPEEAKFYVSSAIGEITCKDKCPNEKKFYSIGTTKGYECLSSCEKKAKIDIDSNTYICTSEQILTCDDDFPYEFEGSCLRNCKDTKELDFFGRKETFPFYSKENDKLICTISCDESYTDTNGQEQQYKLYKSSEITYCVEDCKQTN